jgi:hypothetical protein
MTVELVLRRSHDDRHRYDVDGVGSLRYGGWASRRAEMRPVDGPALAVAPRGLMSRSADATTAAGEPIGEFAHQRKLTHGGTVEWRGRTLTLRSEAFLTSRYALVDGSSVLLEVRASGWGRTPARAVLGGELLEPGLVLFTLWLVNDFVAQDSSSGG